MYGVLLTYSNKLNMNTIFILTMPPHSFERHKSLTDSTEACCSKIKSKFLFLFRQTVKFMGWVHKKLFNIGIKHGFSCINICQVPREVLKTELEDRGV